MVIQEPIDTHDTPAAFIPYEIGGPPAPAPERHLAILGGAPAFSEPLHVGRPNIGDRARLQERIDAMLDRLGIETTRVQGYRVTDAATMEIVEMVLSGATNKGIVQTMNEHGGRAIGLSGKDGGLLRVTKFMPDGIDIGFVGEVAEVCPRVLRDLISAGYLPIIAPIGVGEDGGSYNINADTAAAAIAGALHAEKFIMLTDVPGVLLDVKDPASLISSVTVSDAQMLIETGQISGGMIPKITACLDAIQTGVSRCHILDGRTPHALLVELFTDGGIGTMVVPDNAGCEAAPGMPMIAGND